MGLKAVSNSASGGGGTPGGSTTQVQYNNAGAFAGSSAATINADGTLNALPEVAAVSGTIKTLALTDANSIQDCSNASAQTITIPLNATVAFAVNTAIAFEQNGAGAVTVGGTAGVTVNGVNGGSVTTGGQYTGLYIRKEATDTWYIEGGATSGSFTSLTATGLTTLSGGQIVKTRVVTAAGAATVSATDFTVIINKTSGAATTVNLPVGVTGTVYRIKDGKGDASANNITVAPAAGNIDGAATYVINTNYGSIDLVYNGTIWNVL